MSEFPSLRKHWDDFTRSSRRRRALVLATTLFLFYHGAATLAWGGGEKSREIFRPLFFGYSGVLKATQSWGMFAMIDKEEMMRVRGVLKSGERVELAPPRDTLSLQSFVERRERKLLSNLAKGGPYSQFGDRYLSAFCLERADLVRVELWIALGRPSAPLPEEQKHLVSCAAPSGGTP